MDIACFLQNDFLSKIETLQESDSPVWGVMNAQEMVEHVSLVFKISHGAVVLPIITKEEDIPKHIAFLKSEKLFRENTKAPEQLVGEKPLAFSSENLAAAKKELHGSVATFFKFFQTNISIKTAHPVFGMLNHEDWLLLHYKHCVHHIRQFNLD